MSFQESSEGWKAKAHVSDVKTPVLIGICALTLVAVFLVAQSFGSAIQGEAFEVVEGASGPELPGESPADEDGRSEAAEKVILVHVGGMVIAPGVYELPEGSRVQAAIDAAGGFSEEAARDSLNLARALQDGEQVIVASYAEASQGTGASAIAGSQAVPGKTNINTAGVAELDALPGIGEATAEKIIADRDANGPFLTIEDLKRVSGIGEKKYAQLADLICV